MYEFVESLVPAPKRIFKYCFESVPHLYPYPELSIPEISGFLENIPIFDGSNIINDGSILIFVGFHFWTPFFQVERCLQPRCAKLGHWPCVTVAPGINRSSSLHGGCHLTR